jgi:hypothetical protein
VEDRTESLSDDARLACFPFQDAVAAANASFPLIDCANSSDDPNEFDIQPRGTGDLPARFQADVEAGTYQFEGFARPFAIEFAEPISIELFANNSELRPIGDWEEPAYYAFWIVAPDQLPTPGTPHGPIDETVPFPDDLGSWLSDSGFEILAEGTTELADGAAPYWTVGVPDWTIETAGGGLVFATFTNVPGQGADGQQVYPIRHNSTVWQIPHPAGPLVVIAPEKWEIPGHPGIDELTDLVATIISTIVPIDGVGPPVPPTTMPPTEPNDETNAPTEAEVAALREAVLDLQGFETFVNDDGVYVLCDTPQFRSETPLAAGLNRPNFGTGTSLEFLEFRSEADRDAHFTAIEDGRSVCDAADDETLEHERIEEDPGHLLVYSTIRSWPGGSNSGVSHVTTVGATGMLSIYANNLDRVNAILAELGLG